VVWHHSRHTYFACIGSLTKGWLKKLCQGSLRWPVTEIALAILVLPPAHCSARELATRTSAGRLAEGAGTSALTSLLDQAVARDLRNLEEGRERERSLVLGEASVQVWMSSCMHT
jgi:hypothetical protein